LPYKSFGKDLPIHSKHGSKLLNKEKRLSEWKESILDKNRINAPIEFWQKKGIIHTRTGNDPTSTIKTQMLWTWITYKPYWKTTKALSRMKTAVVNTKKKINNISRTLYSKPSTIFLPKNNAPCSNKGNALLATNLDTSRKTAHLKGNSKLFPITNPTTMKRIASPRKIIKRRK